MIESFPVVEAKEMGRIEKLAYAAGASEEMFMEEAGKGIAEHTYHYYQTHLGGGIIALLIGKGNNGGDAYVAARYLMKKGIPVVAYALFPKEQCSPLSQKQCNRFVKEGGALKPVQTVDDLAKGKYSLFLDGLCGTGFHGAAEGLLKEVIDCVNALHISVLSIDIPSGLNGNDGAVESSAIEADLTLFLGLPKWGFFHGQGWNHVGKLVYTNFGLEEKYTAQAHAVARLLKEQSIKTLLPKIERTRHKYQAGYVIGLAGSKGMGGAAVLASVATLKSGAGITRLFHAPHMEEELTSSLPEVIHEEFDGKDFTTFFTEAKRAKGCYIGPGLGRDPATASVVEKVLKELTIPLVIDADALYHLAEHPHWTLPQNAILTPHKQEMARLLPKDTKVSLVTCQQFVDEKNVILVLKGAPTMVFAKGKLPLIISAGVPGMATAGSGDVLTGILAAQLAQGLDPYTAAVVGVYLHGRAGEEASFYKTDYAMTASDIIDYLADVYLLIIEDIDE